ncbi:transposase [Neobacillus drentensis]|uniref:transposase n=1 Tax=Neobacillus drentensis TaxID=220684 RepID=UPI002FFF706D
MVRKVLPVYKGAKYHITSRGVRRSTLFFNDDDFEKYLAILKETKERYPFILHTYCLMTNHTHLQLEMLEIPPSIIMKNLNTKFAKYINRKYEFSGHVFEKRYGAEHLSSPEYEIDVSKYIHLNPVSAGMVAMPEDYRWSSCRSYIFGESIPLIDPNLILSYFPDPPISNYERYLHTPYTDKFFWENGKIHILDEEGYSCGQR